MSCPDATALSAKVKRVISITCRKNDSKQATVSGTIAIAPKLQVELISTTFNEKGAWLDKFHLMSYKNTRTVLSFHLHM